MHHIFMGTAGVVSAVRRLYTCFSIDDLICLTVCTSPHASHVSHVSHASLLHRRDGTSATHQKGLMLEMEIMEIIQLSSDRQMSGSGLDWAGLGWVAATSYTRQKDKMPIR